MNNQQLGRRVMVDLETLGRGAGCVILSIGAVVFDEVTGELGHTFYTSISRASCLAAGLTEDESTVTWWSRQAPEAQQALRDAESLEAPSLTNALMEFAAFLNINDEVWGNGSDFDNVILAAAYSATGMILPWKFWNNRCYRTLKNLRPEIKLERIGTHHNALDDAKTQAAHAIQLLRALSDATPSSRWSAAGGEDPHEGRYDCERADLAMGDMTDDELANAVFMHGNESPRIEDVLAGKAMMPIAYLTAAKDRIRWLSRSLEKARAAIKETSK